MLAALALAVAALGATAVAAEATSTVPSCSAAVKGVRSHRPPVLAELLPIRGRPNAPAPLIPKWHG